jgi:hypothetical protein
MREEERKRNKDKADLRGKKEVKRMEPVMIVVVATRRCDLACCASGSMESLCRSSCLAANWSSILHKLRLKCGGSPLITQVSSSQL